MVELASRAARGDVPLVGLEGELTELAVQGYHPRERISEALLEGWERGVEHLLEDGQLSIDEEQHLAGFKEHFALAQEVLDRQGAFSCLIKAAVLRDLMEGRLPQRIRIDGHLPISLQKSEHLVWVFPSTIYYEDRIRREYVGRSQGVSIRIAKGVYYRTGAFKGHPVQTTQRVLVGTGIFAVTDKHIYFVGGQKSLRVRHDKIISLIPFDDGVGLHRDAATAKPQIFVTRDGWFTYNLLSNIGNV